MEAGQKEISIMAQILLKMLHIYPLPKSFYPFTVVGRCAIEFILETL
jgi:hypothetical protein